MPIQKWKTLASKVIFEHPRLTLIEDTVLLPDGKQTMYLRFQKKGHAATIIAVRDDGHILLSREYSHPPAQVLYQFPGGAVPDGEALAEGANRELTEECGLSGNLQEIGSYFIDNRRSSAKMHVFVATNLTEAYLPGDAEEFIEHDWHSVDQLNAMIRNGIIKNAHLLAAWTLFTQWSKHHLPKQRKK